MPVSLDPFASALAALPEVPIAPDPTEEPFVWRCGVCGRRETFGAEEIDRFLNEGWPVCCGEAALCYLLACEPGRREGRG